MNRRTFLTGLATTGVVALSGCVSDPLHHEAEPARFQESAIQSSPYELENANKISVQDIVSNLSGEDFSDRFTAESYIMAYRQQDLPQSMAILSTPSMGVGGTELNPIAKADTKTIIELFVGQVRQQDSNLSIEEIEMKEERPIETSLGEKTLEVFDVEMSSNDFGTIHFDIFVVKHNEDSSVLFTTAIILREIESFPSEYNGYEAQKEQALEILPQVEFPFDWSDVRPDQAEVEESGDSTSDSSESSSTDNSNATDTNSDDSSTSQ